MTTPELVIGAFYQSGYEGRIRRIDSITNNGCDINYTLFALEYSNIATPRRPSFCSYGQFMIDCSGRMVHCFINDKDEIEVL